MPAEQAQGPEFKTPLTQKKKKKNSLVRGGLRLVQ
jgi:hypothetical protein